MGWWWGTRAAPCSKFQPQIPAAVLLLWLLQPTAIHPQQSWLLGQFVTSSVRLCSIHSSSSTWGRRDFSPLHGKYCSPMDPGSQQWQGVWSSLEGMEITEARLGSSSSSARRTWATCLQVLAGGQALTHLHTHLHTHPHICSFTHALTLRLIFKMIALSALSWLFYFNFQILHLPLRYKECLGFIWFDSCIWFGVTLCIQPHPSVCLARAPGLALVRCRSNPAPHPTWISLKSPPVIDKLDTGPGLHANKCGNNISSSWFFFKSGLPSFDLWGEHSCAHPYSHFQAGKGLCWKQSSICFLGKVFSWYIHLSKVRSIPATAPWLVQPGRPSGTPCPLVNRASNHQFLYIWCTQCTGELSSLSTHGASHHSLTSLHLECNCSLSSFLVPDFTLRLLFGLFIFPLYVLYILYVRLTISLTCILHLLPHILLRWSSQIHGLGAVRCQKVLPSRNSTWIPRVWEYVNQTTSDYMWV